MVGDNWLVARGGREEEAERRADTTLKTKTPRVNVGNNEKQAPNIEIWKIRTRPRTSENGIPNEEWTKAPAMRSTDHAFQCVSQRMWPQHTQAPVHACFMRFYDHPTFIENLSQAKTSP